MRVLFCPTLGLDLSLPERLAASVDYPVEYKVLWNNGALGSCEEFATKHPDWFVKDSAFGNLGVAGSWNQCAQMFLEDNQAVLLVNDDCHFLPGQLEQLCSAADHNASAPLIHVNDSHAYYCFILTRAGLLEFGSFDTNFFPAYYEDCDYRVRHRLMGVRDYPYALQGQTPVPHGKFRTGGVNYTAMLQGCGLLNRAYWLKKWGSFNYENTAHQVPYRDHRIGVHEWVWDPAHRAKLYPLWETFMSLPNPSIYD